MPNKTISELIEYLKKPYSGEGTPGDWSYNETTKKWTHAKTGETADNPVTTSVLGIWDIYSCADLSDTNYKAYIFTLLVSVESSGLEINDKDKLREVVNELILLIDEKRTNKNKLNSNLFGKALEATQNAYNSTIQQEGAHTFIGPCALGDDIPVVQVGVYENYKVEMMQSLMGISDPAHKSSKADVVLEVKLAVPYGSINDRLDKDGKTIRGLKSILGTLKIAPVCEIRSSAIYPVFVNSLLSPDSFDVIKDRLSSSDKNKIAEHQQKINDSLTGPGTTTRDIGSLFRPAGSPTSLSELTKLQVQTVIDGDTFHVASGTINSGTLTADQRGHLSVRIIGINTPEIKHTNERGQETGRDEPGGQEAKQALEEIISRSGGYVYVQTDVDLKDDYERNLRHVFVAGNNGQPQLVGSELLVKGHASPLNIEPNSKYKDAFMDADLGSRIPGLRNFGKLLKEENPLVNYISGNAKQAGVDTPVSPEKKFITIPCAFKGYIIESVNKNHSMIVSLFFNRFNDENFNNGKILYIDKNGDSTANVEDCPWVFKLAEHSVFSPKGTMNDFSVTDTILNFSWKDRQTNIQRSFKPAKDKLLIESINVRGFMKSVNIPVLNSPYGVSQYMGIDNIVAKIKLVCSSPFELAKFHEMKAELDKVSYGEYIQGVKLDTVKIYEPILHFLGASEFLISSIGTTKIEESDSWNIEMDIVESKIKSRDVEQLSLLNTGLSDEQDLKKIWDYLHKVLEGEGDQKDYDFVNELVFSPSNSGVNSLIDPNIMWATWLFDWQKRSGKTKFVSNSAQENGDEFAEAIGHLFFTETWGKVKLNPHSIFNTSNISIIPRDWIQKGQEDLKDKTDPIETIFLDPALTEVRESGQEVLEAIGEKNKTKTTKINFTKQAWDDYYDLLINNKIKPDTSSEPVWRQDEISVAREKIFGLIASAAYTNLSNNLKETLDRYKGSIIQKETVVSNQSKNTKAKVASNHAYITLPTYHDMFGDGELWKKFAPTYEDMGKKVSFTSAIDNSGNSEAQKAVYRNINDPIEPTFYLFHQRVKSEVVAAAFNQNKEFSRILENTNIIAIPDKYKNSPASAIGDYIDDIFKDPRSISDSSAENKRIERERLRALGEGDSLGVFSLAGTHLGYAIKEGNLIKFVPVKGKKEVVVNALGEATHSVFSAEDNLKLTNDILARKPDFGFNPMRLYPSYRLYFIEPDSGYEIETDDLYGMNSIMELGLRMDKYDTAVLTASISNVTNNLGEDEVISDSTREKLELSQDEDAQIFTRIKVQPGTLVKLFLGYGTLPKDLDCVFTGMITECRPGKILEIVAQCHKRELMNEVQFYLNGTNHFDIIRKILEKSETPNLGAPVGAKIASYKTMKAMFPDMVDFRDYTGKYDKIMNTKLVNMRNIYLPSSGHIEVNRAVLQNRDTNIFAAIPASVGWIGYRIGDIFRTPWICPPQTGWDAILEVTRHRPGTIAQVVPFGNKGTLFVGYPDQPYLAEKITPEEDLAYQNTVTEEYKKVEEYLDKLVNEFMLLNSNSEASIRTRLNTMSSYIETFEAINSASSEFAINTKNKYGNREDIVTYMKENNIPLEELFFRFFRLDAQPTKIKYARLESDIIDLMGEPETSGKRLLYKLENSNNEYDVQEEIFDSGSKGLMRDLMRINLPAFKVFVVNLYDFIKNNPTKLPKSFKRFDRDILPPGYKCFRDYHYISTKDIIANNIYTSMEEMSNCILLRAPATPTSFGTTVSSTEDNRGEDTETVVVDHDDTSWASYPTSDGAPFNYKVAKENRKLGVAVELNANDQNQKAMTLMSNMGLMLQPLYNGNLLVVGRNIKPHDVIFLDDGFNDMRGVIEVKTVVQTFSVETGWITEITPHALVNVNVLSNNMQLVNLSSALKAFSRGTEIASTLVDIGWVIGLILITLGTGGAAAPGTVGAGAASTGAGTATATATTAVASAAGRTAIFRAAASRALTSSGLRKVTQSSVGGFLRGMGGTKGLLAGSILFALQEAADTMESIYVKAQYESTQLPIDVHLLTYKGVPFQAGLSSSNEDIYYLYDKFVPGFTTFRQGLADFFTDVYNDLAGNSGKDYVENARKQVEENE